MMKHELHETFAGREPTCTRSATEWEARLTQGARHDERLERSRRDLDLLHPDDAGASVDSVDGEVATVRIGSPRHADRGIRRKNRIEAERHQIERREEVPALRRRQRAGPERRELRE